MRIPLEPPSGTRTTQIFDFDHHSNRMSNSQFLVAASNPLQHGENPRGT